MASLDIPEDLDLSNLDNKQKIVLLDKVFFKILASETDLDFEENLARFLPKLLLKLATGEEPVRKKIMEIFVHINKRIKSRPSVQLPLQDLLDMFNDPAYANMAFFTNFSLIYIKLAFPRLSSQDKGIMVERLLNSLEGKSNAHMDSLLSMVVDGIRYLSLQPNENPNKIKYGLANSPKLRKYFLDYLYYFLLLPYSTNIAKPVVNEESNTTATPGSSTPSNTTPVSDIPAGFSETIYKRFKNDFNLDSGDEIEQLKIGILKFLACTIYESEEILFHFVVSTSDTRYTIVQVAEIHIKRIVGGVDLNDPAIVNRFFQIFLGSDKMTVKSVPDRIEPANTRIRLKLFPYMLRSKHAACTMPQAIQLVFDCLFGSALSTNQKIKNYAVQFVHLIALYCEEDKLTKVGKILIQGMNKLISEAKDDSKLRGLAYVAVGKLARKLSNIIANDIFIVHNFFTCLEKEDNDTKLHIQEALVLMIDALRSSTVDQKNLLLSLLFQYIENEVSHCRSMCVKYAFEVFDQDHLESRYLLLLATSDAKEEIRQEATKYLRRTEDGDGKELKMANFEQWVEFISKKMDERLKKSNKLYTFGTHTLAFDINCYQELLVILRMTLSKSAQLKPQIVESKYLESIRDQTHLLAKYVKQLAESDKADCLGKYVNIVKEFALTVGSALSIYLLLEICSIGQLNTSSLLKDDLEWLKNQSFSVNEQVRFYSAELWALVFTNSFAESNNFDAFFNTLSSMNKTVLLNNLKSFESKHGCILDIAYAIGKYYSLKRRMNDVHKEHIKSLLASIITFLDDPNLSTASIIAIGEIARSGPIVIDSSQNLFSLIEILYKKIQTTKETTKVKEKAATTLGHLCIHPFIVLSDSDIKYTIKNESDGSETSFASFSQYVMYRLLNSSQAKQFELHMAIGDALVNSALGPRSNASLNSWVHDLSMDQVDVNTKDNSDVEWLLNELINSYLPSQNQHLRQAACFWLLALLNKCAKLPATSEVITKNIYKVQDAFVQKLGESDEITQEVASKGIGIMFSIADGEQKQALVNRLVEALVGGAGPKKSIKPAATSVESGLKITNENEEIFSKDQIGKTPEGGNITTYKELCSLASDLNRPDLIYQFMNLAHHNSIWNTRRGAAFGFNHIINMSSEALQPYLASIVPKLFRYQFDPNARIQQSMSSIWHSIIKQQDHKKIVDDYLLEILVDLEQNILSPLWRVRESCCTALCDLIKGGRNLESISMKFGQFWRLLFKVADDIKESVRVAAELTLKSLQRVTISYSTSVSNVAVCQQTINSVLPILIVDGLQNNIQEVRSISVLTIRDLIKLSTTSLIRPYLVDMIINLLETLSGYEPPDLNYLSVRLGGSSQAESAQEKLDQARIAASRSTPMVEIITMCLSEHIKEENDTEILGELVPRLIDIIKKGLGVSTKAGVCNLITSLIDQRPAKMSPYSGKLMGVLVNAMSSEPNKTINKCYCNCLGCIVKVAKESSLENLIAKLQEWYFEKDSDGLKLSCGNTLLAMAQNASNETVMAHLKKTIPFVFFAMHQHQLEQLKVKQNQNQLQQQTVSVWDEVFDEITTGTEYAIRANLPDILTFVRLGLEHQSWKLRMQAALCVCTVTNKLQSSIDQDRLNELLKMMIAALSVKTWSGKDKVLMAVSSIFNNCKLKLNIENPLVDEIAQAMFKEANKQSDSIDLAYKQCSLRSLADVIQFTSAQFKDSYFEQYWSGFVADRYFADDLATLIQKDKQKVEHQIESYKTKHLKLAMDVDEHSSSEPMEQTAEKEEQKDQNVPPAAEVTEEDKEKEELNTAMKMIILETLGKVWPCGAEVQEKYILNSSLIINEYLNKVTWTNQLSIVKSVDSILNKWSIEFEDDSFDMLQRSVENITQAVINCIAKTTYSNLRRDGFGVVEKVVHLLIKTKESNEAKWSKMVNKKTIETETVADSIRKLNQDNLIDSIRVLLAEFSARESLMDLREKAKLLLKTLFASF